MTRYLITRHDHLDGVRVSKPGCWGNIPYPDEAAALAAIERDAGGKRFKIERSSHPALSKTFVKLPFLD